MITTFGRLLVAAVLAMAGPAAAGAPPPVTTADGWDQPVILDGPAEVGIVDAVVAPNGDMAVAWTNARTIQVSTRRAGGAWTSYPTLVAHASSAELEVDGDGVFHLAWSHGARVLERLSTPGGWSPPRLVLQAPAVVRLLDYDVNERGGELVGAVVVGQGAALVTRRSAAGSWSRLTRWDHVVRLDLELSDGGQAAALVNRFRPAPGSDVGTLTFGVMRQLWGRHWGAQKVLFRDPNAGAPWPGMGGVVVDRAGTTTVTWHTPSHTIVAARASRGGWWHAPAVLAGRTRDLDERAIRIMTTPAGATLVVFVRGATTVTAVRRPVHGAWGRAETVSPEEPFVGDWDGALGPGGQAIAVWTVCRQPGARCRAVRAAVTDDGGTWGAPFTISSGAGPDGRAVAVALAHREAVVEWLQLAAHSVDARVHVRTWSGPAPTT